MIKNKLPKRSDEKGAVMILFALLLAALFAFIALTIDTVLITSSQSHLRTSADAAVFGALEVYGNRLSATTPGTPAQALNDAIAAANISLGLNFNNNPGKFLQKVSTNTQNVLSDDCTLITGNGCLRPIVWYPPVPSGGVCGFGRPYSATDPDWRPCPCDQSCECGDGCPGDPRAASPERAGNGLKLIYRTDRNSPLKALFGSVINLMNGGSASEVGFMVTSTALLTPRNAVFLLDLSGSMVALATPGAFPTNFYDQNPVTAVLPIESRPPRTNQICNKRFYNYPLSVAGSCDPMDIHSISPLNPLVGSSYYDTRNNYYNCEVGGYLGGAPSQYACFSGANSIPVQFNGSTTRQDSFLVNTVVDPEPLTSALGAVNEAMNSFMARRVPNDRLGIIGFDDTQINNRILGSNITGTIQPALLGDPLFAEFELATRVTGARRIPITDVRRYSKFLFPRFFSQGGVPNTVFSDLPQAFLLARNMITNTPNFRQSQNFVVMFSDGMSNCLSPLAPPERCNTLETTFNQSLSLLQTELGNYTRDRITAHFLLLGAKAQPHRLAWKNSSGKCASADEIPSLTDPVPGLPVVSAQGAFNSAGSPLVNQIYPWIKATGGIWAPILDSYGVNPAGACPLVDRDAFNLACSGLVNSTNRNALISAGSNITGGIVLGGGPATWSPASSYWDTNGRIVCDPQNRTTQEQVSDAMKVILGKPPFVLVRPT